MTDQELIDRLRHYAQIAHAAASWGFAGEGEVMNRAAALTAWENRNA